MKIKIRADHPGMPRKSDWHQMDDWLAELPDDGSAEPPGDGRLMPDGAGDPWPEARAAAAARAEAEAAARAEAEAAARAEAEAAASVGPTVRAVIGDQLRMPIMWCEMDSCISWYADPAALGEADTRARAIGVGWRIDALGRLACPQCQQSDPGFWASRPVAPWDRYMAIARAARITAVPGDGTAGTAALRSSRDRHRLASAAASPPEPGWHRQYPAAHDPHPQVTCG
jgi:hypothetical protein